MARCGLPTGRISSSSTTRRRASSAAAIDAKTGAGGAHENPLRDHARGRIYRVVWDKAKKPAITSLAGANTADLVKALGSDNQFWRLTAQRLLVEGKSDAADALKKAGHGQRRFGRGDPCAVDAARPRPTRRRAASCKKHNAQGLPATEEKLLTGDAQRGAQIFSKHPTAACILCHSLHGQGSTVGPALDGIASRKDAAYIQESLLEPNKVLAEGFQQLGASPMPPMGLILKPQEIEDIKAYLQTLK